LSATSIGYEKKRNEKKRVFATLSAVACSQLHVQSSENRNQISVAFLSFSGRCSNCCSNHKYLFFSPRLRSEKRDFLQVTQAPSS
jgi:hypothetical protein